MGATYKSIILGGRLYGNLLFHCITVFLYHFLCQFHEQIYCSEKNFQKSFSCNCSTGCLFHELWVLSSITIIWCIWQNSLICINFTNMQVTSRLLNLATNGPLKWPTAVTPQQSVYWGEAWPKGFFTSMVGQWWATDDWPSRYCCRRLGNGKNCRWTAVGCWWRNTDVTTYGVTIGTLGFW